jgi:hypothetical protein
MLVEGVAESDSESTWQFVLLLTDFEANPFRGGE